MLPKSQLLLETMMLQLANAKQSPEPYEFHFGQT